jgi:predicted GNAT family acetyltransferase
MTQTTPQNCVVDNIQRHRFELVEQGLTAYADYRREPGRLIIPHVEAPLALRGGGAAGRLMLGVAEQARAAGETIVPLCGYAAAWLRRHPEYADLIG